MAGTDPIRRDAANNAGALLVEDCDIPDGMTIHEWRAALAAERRAAHQRRPRLLRRLAGRRRRARGTAT